MSYSTNPTYDELRRIIESLDEGDSEQERIVSILDTLFYMIGHNATVDMVIYSLDVMIRCLIRVENLQSVDETENVDFIITRMRRTLSKVMWSASQPETRQPFRDIYR